MPLESKVSVEKPVFTEDPLYVLSCFSVGAFKIFFLSLSFLQFDYDMSRYGSL